MKLALNGATTMKASLETDIRVAGAAGFDCLEIWAAKLRVFLQSRTTSELTDLFKASGVAPYSINSIEHITFRSEAARRELLAECEQMCRIASEIACPYVVVVPGLLPEGATRADVVDESVNTLKELGVIAEAFGIGLAFEFLGQPDCSVQTLELANEIVACVSRRNVGLVVDSFHLYAGGSSIASMDELDSERLFIFHINDAEDRPRNELEDSHRLLPGLGILPLSDMIAALRRIGYERVISVEIFRPEYWERDPLELARDAREAVAKLLRD